ncbi:hypothetical protein P7C70_g3522, partial [Phenoliferia sp. Uapishka_3]
MAPRVNPWDLIPPKPQPQPLAPIQPPHQPTMSRKQARYHQVATPIKVPRKVQRRSSIKSTLRLDSEDDLNKQPPTSINTFPTEILLHILELAEYSSKDLIEAQIQRQTHALVSKSWSRIVSTLHTAGESLAVRGFKTSRRLMRVFNADPHRANEVARLDFDLMRTERGGTRGMVADCIKSCAGLKELELLFFGRGRNSPDAACLGVPIYEAIGSREELVELKLFFKRGWTSLTLGGDLSLSLSNLPKLKRLSLPLILVPRVDATFPFSPPLTHLSMHITSSSCLLLLSHFITNSRLTLLHLHLTIHDRPDLRTLPHVLKPIAQQLLSFSLDYQLSYEQGLSGAKCSYCKSLPGFTIPFTSILSPMISLTSLFLADSLLPPLSVLSTLPRLRHLRYRISCEDSYTKFSEFVVEEEDEGRLRLTSLELCESWVWERRLTSGWLENLLFEDGSLLEEYGDTWGYTVKVLEEAGKSLSRVVLG